ncbi:acyl carrier protein [Streptomyces noursei]|uniref:acyl carrier protein n=1 Tax=Streptomyces noursei TaxID=1971 RepID=UPI001674B46C|nr:acyl carrier protein [Streptomyces noursei]MCZ1020750.1 acyl carrier protein [Streptomyces noursei]GGX28563.1 hypothetical protein GCM10010341_57520 [Streptomyces noursei]
MDTLTAAALLRSHDVDRYPHAAAYLRALLAGCLGTTPDRITLEQSLDARGFDSVTIAGISVTIEEDLGLRLPLADLATTPLADLARLLATDAPTGERRAGEDGPADR